MMSPETHKWIEEFKRCLKNKPESIELYADNNGNPLIKLEILLNESSSNKRSANAEPIHYKVHGLTFKKIHPRLINGYNLFGKNKTFKEYGYQLRINMLSTILRIPVFDKRIRNLETDFSIENTTQLTSLIEACEKAKEGNITNLIAKVNYFKIKLNGSVTADLIKETDGKYWKIGEKRYKASKFETIDEIEQFIFSKKIDIEPQLGGISQSQFNKLMADSHAQEISFEGPNDTQWIYNNHTNSLVYMNHHDSAESIYCVFHASNLEQAHEIYEVIIKNNEHDLLNMHMAVTIADGLLPIGERNDKVYLNLSSHPELRGVIEFNEDQDIVLKKKSLRNTISSDLQDSDFYPLLENYKNFSLALPPLCLRCENGELYLGDTYGVFEEQLIGHEEIILSITQYLSKIDDLPEDWQKTVNGDYLFTRRLELASGGNKNDPTCSQHLAKLAKKQAVFSFMARFVLNKFNDKFYLCEPFNMAYDQEVSLDDLEDQVKRLEISLRKMDI